MAFESKEIMLAFILLILVFLLVILSIKNKGAKKYIQELEDSIENKIRYEIKHIERLEKRLENEILKTKKKRKEITEKAKVKNDKNSLNLKVKKNKAKKTKGFVSDFANLDDKILSFEKKIAKLRTRK